MLKSGEHNNEVPVINDEGNSITYVVDLAQQVAVLLREKRELGIYHITNSGQASWYGFAN